MAENRIANHLTFFQKDIESCATLRKDLGETFQKTFDEVHALTSMWTGAGQSAFFLQFENDADNMDKLIAFLDDYLRELEEARKKYQECEDQVAEIIRSLRI